MSSVLPVRLFRLGLLCLGLIGGVMPAMAERVSIELGPRHYLIDLPETPSGAPILLALHGGGGSPEQFARTSGLSSLANPQGYAVIYPAGSGRGRLLTWNGGYCCGFAARRKIDDIAFLTRVVEDASRRYGLDRQRVYVTGMSNGAIMAETFAALRPEQVKAAAGVAGTPDRKVLPPKGPVPLLHIHGTQDDRVPFSGGIGSAATQGTDFTPVPEVLSAFRQAFGPLVERQSLIDRQDDGTRVLQRDWTDDGRIVQRLLLIDGGGHVWPGGRRAKRQDGATAEISASEEILRFFALHP